MSSKLLRDCIRSSLLCWFGCRLDEAFALVSQYALCELPWVYKSTQYTVHDMAIEPRSGYIFLLRWHNQVDVVSECGHLLWTFFVDFSPAYITIHTELNALIFSGTHTGMLHLVDLIGRPLNRWSIDGHAGQCVVDPSHRTYVHDEMYNRLFVLDANGTTTGVETGIDKEARRILLIDGGTKLAVERPRGIKIYRLNDHHISEMTDFFIHEDRFLFFDGASLVTDTNSSGCYAYSLDGKRKGLRAGSRVPSSCFRRPTRPKATAET